MKVRLTASTTVAVRVPTVDVRVPTKIRIPRLESLSMGTLTSFFFLATLFCCTFEKVHWRFGGAIAISDVLALGFIFCWVILSRLRFATTSMVLFGFFVLFALVYLIGFYNLDSSAGLDQFAKGFAKFLIHFTFMGLAVTWLWRRGQAYYWRSLEWFFGGMAVNAVYGIVQLVFARAGVNLDSLLVSPLTGGASRINIYGAVNGSSVYRPNALTGDPNHLAIMLILPLLVLTPLYLRLEAGHRLRRKLAVLIGFLLLVEASTLSRSGLLGLLVGAVILALPYRHYLKSRVLLYPLAGVFAVLVVVILTRLHYFIVVIRSRIQTGRASQSAHFQVYEFIPQIMHSHPLFGLGLNNFSLYYQAATGKTNWGPHSFYVSLVVDSGAVGTVVFFAFLGWVFLRLNLARAIGRVLTEAGDPLASRVAPVAWGWTAGLAGTMVANAFYLTMTFYYFYVFIALAVAVPVVFGAERMEARSAPLVPAPA